MDEQQKNVLRAEIKSAIERIFFKSIVFHSAYRFVLQAHLEAYRGNAELHATLERLEDQLRVAQMDTNEFYRSLMYIDLISEVETFFSTLLKSILYRYPKKLSESQFRLADIVDSASTDELIYRAAEAHIYKLMYKSPNEYLKEICELLSIDRKIIEVHWPVYIEAKARRDLGAHNNWVCNATYLRKLGEVGVATSAKIGDRLLPSDDDSDIKFCDCVMNMTEAIGQVVLDKYA